MALALARLDAYPFLASEMAEALGMPRAEQLLKRAIRHQGRYRGDAIRREVEGRGLPLDVAHLSVYWDTPRRYSEKDTPRQVHEREPHYAAFDILGCGFHEQLRELCPQRLAVLMCEVDHKAMAREFNPAIHVWYPALLTRGEAKCVFRFTMSREAAEAAARQAERVRQAARQAGKPLAGERPIEVTSAPEAYRQLSRVIAIFYHFVVDELLRAVGFTEADALVRRAMRSMGTWRGRTMREDHQRRGWPLTVASFIAHCDDPAAGNAWLAENVVLTTHRHSKDITASAFTAMFRTLGTGRLAAPYFEEALPAQAQAYHPEILVTVPYLMERGDPFTRFCCEMETAHETRAAGQRLDSTVAGCHGKEDQA